MWGLGLDFLKIILGENRIAPSPPKKFFNLNKIYYYIIKNRNYFLGIGDWGLGIGDWGLRNCAFFIILLAGLVAEDYHISSPSFGGVNQIFFNKKVFFLPKKSFFLIKKFFFNKKFLKTSMFFCLKYDLYLYFLC